MSFSTQQKGPVRDVAGLVGEALRSQMAGGGEFQRRYVEELVDGLARLGEALASEMEANVSLSGHISESGVGSFSLSVSHQLPVQSDPRISQPAGTAPPIGHGSALPLARPEQEEGEASPV